MDKNTQQPVAEVCRNSAGQIYMANAAGNMFDMSKYIGEKLYTAPPVPREVLMAFGEELSNAVKEAAKIRVGNFYPYVGFSRVNITALADRYASQVQPEPVNQQLLAALKSLYRGYVSTLETGRDRIVALGGQCDAVDVMDRNDPVLRDARAAIAAAEAAQPVAQQYLLGGRRFKVTHSQDHGFAITGLPQTMNGQWVAFVDATDNCHMQQQLPASAQQVTVPDGYVLVPLEPTSKILGEICHAKNQTASGYKATMTDTELASIYRAMLSAAQKPEGV